MRKHLTWIFDLDNTLHDARPQIFPSMHRQINAYLMRHFAVDEEGANAMRRQHDLRSRENTAAVRRRLGK